MNKLIVSSSPHFRAADTTHTIMRDVVIALCPALIAATIIFGWRVLMITAVCITGCVLSEYISRRVMKRNNTIGDFSAVVTGILLAMNLPVSINPLIALFGSVVAIVVVKQMFGGIGQNFVNPALTARIILLSSFPSKMTTWTEPFAYISGVDSVSGATPLASPEKPAYLDLFLGTTSGCMGETCAAALLLGGLYLIFRKVISPVIPLCYLGTVGVMALLLGQDPLFHLLSGGLMLGAIFMATDYTTSPITFWGRVIFAVGCGVITILIRVFGALPEGVSFSILIMNILVPHIESLTMPKAFGERKCKQHEKA